MDLSDAQSPNNPKSYPLVSQSFHSYSNIQNNILSIINLRPHSDNKHYHDPSDSRRRIVQPKYQDPDPENHQCECIPSVLPHSLFSVAAHNSLPAKSILQEIGVEDKNINPYIAEWVESFNEKYPQLRV